MVPDYNKTSVDISLIYTFTLLPQIKFYLCIDISYIKTHGYRN